MPYYVQITHNVSASRNTLCLDYTFCASALELFLFDWEGTDDMENHKNTYYLFYNCFMCEAHVVKIKYAYDYELSMKTHQNRD